MAAERARPHSQRVGGSDLRLGSSTAVPVDAGTLLLTCEAASKTVCGGRSISSLNGDLGPMVVFFDPFLRLDRSLGDAAATCDGRRQIVTKLNRPNGLPTGALFPSGV